METNFTSTQLADPAIAESEKILRACVHCGFCTATCPTYVLLGDELDSPRGRIYLIKDMLENDRPATERVVRHIDRCLSCLSCMTTCPSGVNYMHLVDHARVHIERTYRRSLKERVIRGFLIKVLPDPRRFLLLSRLAVFARLIRPIKMVLPWRMRAMVDLAPRGRLDAPLDPGRHVFPAQGERRHRVLLLPGCVQQVLARRINDATVRLLNRHGCEVVVAEGTGCCGALTHHMGREEEALAAVRANVRSWAREIDGQGVDAIVVNASGCGTTVKDYGFLLRSDPELAAAAERMSELACDISEMADRLGVRADVAPEAINVTYHSACSLQHGQKIVALPKRLLAACGFSVVEPPESHICCGSAGTYNLLQPEIALRLRARKASAIARTDPDVVATGNIGCLIQLRDAVAAPIVHTVELLDWATGGPRPGALS